MPPARVEVLAFGLGDVRLRGLYDELFEQCDFAFIQQSSLWAEVIAPLGPDEPTFLLATAEGKSVAGLPLYLFTHPLGNVLSSVPQAGPLGGIFFRAGLSPEVIGECYAALLAESMEFARQRECLSLSIISNPFQDDGTRYSSALKPDYVLENFTQATDVTTWFDDAGKVRHPDYHRRSNLSRNLAKARDAGLRVRREIGPEELDQLYSLHLKRHTELAATPLDLRLLQNIATILVPRKKAFFLVVDAGDRVASWAVYIHHRRVLDVLRLNMDSDFAAFSPNFLNTDESLRVARDLGLTCYNWQSSPSRESGVYHYKHQWGARESNYCFFTKLFCSPDRVREIGLARLQSDYRLHFVVPYAAASNDFATGHYRKS